MKTNEIIMKIENSFSEDYDKNLQILIDNLKYYQANFNQEVVEELQILALCLHDYKNKELRSFQRFLFQYEKLKKDSFVLAYKYLKEYINILEQASQIRDSDYEFNEEIEYYLFSVYNKNRVITSSKVNIAKLYQMAAEDAYEILEYEEALFYIKKAYKYLVANVKVALLYCDILEALKDYDTFYSINKRTYQYIYDPKDFASYLRNMGLYYTEKKNFYPATASYIASLAYDYSKEAQQELNFLANAYDLEFEFDLKPDDLKAVFEEYNIEQYISNDVLYLAYKLANNAIEKKEFEKANYFYSIVYLINKDEQVANILKELNDI